ncbi:TetR/AcrR family transcriptional regulator [Acaryochloris sp. IP29b_bin.148]|uniref:TetR/AcrR family transcriptional regulator n=1 Tax=Acaryochloris sp. IP29b_bin.148 TaxID=2969218 RepID=UPI0026116A8B|nr:TetR/AcrR family transcriptional regulator [Acaryochloris sp. IP29b_bin.148]
MSPKIVDREAKRQAILAAAIAVFAEKGYHSTKMADIAQRAEMGKGTLYEYFRTKEELPKTIFGLMLQEFDQQILQLEQVHSDPVDAILAGIQLCFQDIDEFAHVTPLVFEVLGNKDLDRSIGLSEDFEQWLESLNRFFLARIQEGQSQGQISVDLPAPIFARMLVSTLDGMATHYCMFHFQPEFFTAQVNVFSDMVKSYLVTPK